MSSELAENIGRAVLDAIRSFQNAPLVAATTTQQPHRSSSASTAPGPGPSRVSTLTAQRTGTSNSTQLTPGSNFHTPNDHSDNYQGRHAISREELENVLILKTTFTEAASILGVSRPTFYKLLQDFNIPTSKFNNISDQQLDLKVSQLKTEHPNVGEVMLMGHLRSINIVVQRRRVRESLQRVDSAGVLDRRRTAIARRVYTVPHPNFIWHVDGNHKLIRWKFVVHGAMDGYSRMLVFLHCSNNNRAETVNALFTAAIGLFGRPLHIRTDHGGENVRIWEDMRASRGEGSVLLGSSVHNQRIERFNRDLNKNCSHVYAPIFYEMESQGILDLENPTDLFCLHYIFLPRINRTLEEFRAAYNHHSISSEGNRTPVQLFALDNHLLHLHSLELQAAEVVASSSLSSQAVFLPLNNRDFQELYATINPLENDSNKGKTLFQRTQQFIFDKLVT
ncbi:uncharacterized protein LOC117819842 [Notolabrus celidotus]|uniref:uncharacterized protein LOC117819842 n=1 Tax=Notolabrus celidotus TaxID=1203425 RepID=UPI00148FBFD7|nr:uncharacterized protein LOC117819842 [Notolabrus celidotus]